MKKSRSAPIGNEVGVESSQLSQWRHPQPCSVVANVEMLFSLVLIWVTLSSRVSLYAQAQIPRISLKDLESFRDSDEAFNLLKDDGGKISAFYVSELGPDFNLTDFRTKAPPCIGGNEDLPALVLNDGSTRKTFGTTDSEVFPVCMGKSMVPLVEAFDRIEGAIVHLLELALNGATVAFSSEPRGERFVLPLEESPVKDHIHVYTKKNNNTPPMKSNSIVPFHVDNGLFLILTPFPEHGINIKTSKGTLLDTHQAQPSDLVVLICRGLTDWFLQKSKTIKRKFFPVPHSVPSFSSSSKNERSVFARMKVVPMDALPLIGGQSRGKRPFKYVFENSDYHESPESICSIDLDQEEEESDSGRNSWLRMMDQQCQAGEAYCWMSCRPFRSECSNIEESICYSTLRNLTCSTQINGLPMDQSCQWECKKDILRSHGVIAPTPNTYCNGKMDMYMAGFEVQGSANGSNPCIILFIEAWTLDSRIKFAFGCIGVFLLGFTIEALISLRRKISSDCRRILSFTGTSRRVKRILLIFSFGLNLALGYLAMLVAMTYSVELFCCVLLGLVCGHAFFNVNLGIISESIDPCCASGTENNYQRERSSRDSYQFSPAPCEEARTSINNTPPNSEDDAGSIPCCSEKQSILRTNDNQRDLVA